MSNPNIKTVTSAADKLKLSLAVLLLAVGIAGYYVLPSYVPSNPVLVATGSLLAGIVLAVVMALLSESGKRFVGFAKDSYNEARRVVWPSRKETLTMTGIVIAFVVVAAIFLWLSDKSIEWILYDLILGWK